MDPSIVLTRAIHALPSDAWERDPPSQLEIFLAAAASLSAYAHATGYELEDSARALVIPSSTFRQALRTRATFTGLLPGADVPIAFVETRYFVASLIKLRDYVLVAYRGTADGYDLFLDLDIRKQPIPSRGGITPAVHRGFLKAFLEGFPHVQERLATLEPYKHLIGSGHSLGGAICAIHNAVSNSYSNTLTHPFSPFFERTSAHAMRSCITFGSPKVGNLPFALFNPWGTNLYHPNDPVPMIPLSSWGYESQPIRRPLLGRSKFETGIKKWLLPFRTKRRLVMFSDHSMEGYVRLCGAAANIDID